MSEQTAEMQNLLSEIQTGWGAVRGVPGEVKTLREGLDKLGTDLKEVRRGLGGRFCKGICVNSFFGFLFL